MKIIFVHSIGTLPKSLHNAIFFSELSRVRCKLQEYDGLETQRADVASSQPNIQITVKNGIFHDIEVVNSLVINMKMQ
jgi:hypothetical protein